MNSLAIATFSAAAISAAASAAMAGTGLCNDTDAQTWFTSEPLQNSKGPPQLRINRTVALWEVNATTCGEWCLSYGDSKGEENGPCAAFSVQLEYGVCQLFREPTTACANDDYAVVTATANNNAAGAAGVFITTTDIVAGVGGEVLGRRGRRCVKETDLGPVEGKGQVHFTRLSECADRVFGASITTTTATTTTATTLTTPVGLSLCDGSVSTWFDSPAYDHKGPPALRVNRYFGLATAAECAQVCVKHKTGCTAFSYRGGDVTCQIFEGSPDSSNADHMLMYHRGTVHYVRKTECSEGKVASVAAAWKKVAAQAVCATEPFINGFEVPVANFKGATTDRMARYIATSLTVEHCAASCAEHTPVCTAFSFNEKRMVCQLFQSDPDAELELTYQEGQRHFVRKAMCFDRAAIFETVAPTTTSVATPAQRSSGDAGEEASGADDDFLGSGGNVSEEEASTASPKEPEVAPTVVPEFTEPPTSTTNAAEASSTENEVGTSRTVQPPPFTRAPKPVMPPKISTNDVVASTENLPNDFGDNGGTILENEVAHGRKKLGTAEFTQMATAIIVVSLLMTAFFVWVYREHYPESDTAPMMGSIDELDVAQAEHIPLLNPTRIVPVPLTLDDYMVPSTYKKYDTDDYTPGYSPVSSPESSDRR